MIFSVSRLAKIVYINVHKKWIQAALNTKHAVNDSWFPIISVHINISKLRSEPKWPLFSNPLTFRSCFCSQWDGKRFPDPKDVNISSLLHHWCLIPNWVMLLSPSMFCYSRFFSFSSFGCCCCWCFLCGFLTLLVSPMYWRNSSQNVRPFSTKRNFELLEQGHITDMDSSQARISLH